jgi:hypothetical protein
LGQQQWWGEGGDTGVSVVIQRWQEEEAWRLCHQSRGRVGNNWSQHLDHGGHHVLQW